MLIDELISKVRSCFAAISEHRNTEKGNLQYGLTDCLSMTYSMFALKDPSLAVYRAALFIGGGIFIFLIF